MVRITEFAENQLFQVLHSGVGGKSNSYGAPPIFYWFCRVIREIYSIESFKNIKRGQHRYQMGNGLGDVIFTCDYIQREKVIIVTALMLNTSAITTWATTSGNGCIVKPPRKPKPRKPYRMLTKKPLYRYRFVMNDKKEYNLIDSKGNLITQWFRAIKPVPKPFGQYNVIAYINVGGFGYCLCMNGESWNTERTWKELFGEGRNTNGDMLFEEKYRTQRIIRLTESDLKRIIIETLTEILIESA